MPVERRASMSPQSPGLVARDQTPSPTGLRHRPALRSTTFNIKEDDPLRRRSSFFSETLSETHKSFRASTDDLLLPRIQTTSPHDDDQIEVSHWHSTPLVLALLPAVGGLFFKDGSAVVTDITLLGLAAIFLNWALRLPWEWYKAAQSTVTIDEQPRSSFSPIDEEEDENLELLNDDQAPKTNGALPKVRALANVENNSDEDLNAAQYELRLHELLALFACFVSPALGAWLLHAIRSQLSRPSEGLVSNYNLTIFILVAELRPLSHFIKLVQKRTLFLQRKVNTRILQEQQAEEKRELSDLSRRLEEIEAHVVKRATASPSETAVPSTASDAIISQAVAQATVNVRKSFQPDLDALSRAMRRYEKRMTITAIQVESRLQDLETRLKDVVALAAAAQRNADKKPRNYTSILANWISGIVVIPLQYIYSALKLPGKVVHSTLGWLRGLFRLNRPHYSKEVKANLRLSTQKTRPVSKKGKTSS